MVEKDPVHGMQMPSIQRTQKTRCNFRRRWKVPIIGLFRECGSVRGGEPLRNYQMTNKMQNLPYKS